jgi:hypothetical protein
MDNDARMKSLWIKFGQGESDVADTITRSAELVYDAAQEFLSGSIGRARFSVKAYSGGGRGHKAGVKSKLAAEFLYSQAITLSSRLATTREEKDAHGHYRQRGGTLPPGHYACHYVAHHHTFGECIQLLRSSDARAIHSPFSPHPIPHGRKDDFFIHGSGPKGSDGCIVLTSQAVRHHLNQAIKHFHGKVVLYVKYVPYLLPAELGDQIA